MGYNEIISILRNHRGGTNIVTNCLAMNHAPGFDSNTVVSGNIGGRFVELSKPNMAENAITNIEVLKLRIQRDLDDRFYNITIPEAATANIVDRTYSLVSSDLTRFKYVTVKLKDIIGYAQLGFMPIIPDEQDRRDIYTKLVELEELYREDPGSLVQLSIDSALSDVIIGLREYIEVTYKSMFIPWETQHGEGRTIRGIQNGLSDGLFSSIAPDLLKIGQNKDLHDDSLASNFRGDECSFSTDALSVYLKN